MLSTKTFIFSFVSVVFCIGNIQAKDPKVLVLITCSDNLPVYKGLQKSWRSYMHSDPEHFESYFLCADKDLPEEVLIEDDIIWCRGQESLRPAILNKTLSSLEVMIPRLEEFDYVLRTNLSSFYVFPRLLNFLTNSPKQRFYCGIHHSADNHKAGWICGAGILMSTDLARMLVANKGRLFNLSPEEAVDHADDVAIGDLFAQNGIKCRKGLFKEIYSEQDWMSVWNNFPTDVFHFRIITPPPYRAKVDLSIHQALLKIIYNKNILFEDFY